MKRGSGPSRRTPMRSGTGLQRSTPKPTARAPIARAPRAPRAASRSSARSDTGPSQDTRALVNARDGGRCVRCGAPASDLDHRRTRGAGGTHGDASAAINRPSNLITLCGAGNTSGCHRWKDDERETARRHGYSLRLNGVTFDASTVPVLTARGWALFLDDGRRVPCLAPPDDDATNAGFLV